MSGEFDPKSIDRLLEETAKIILAVSDLMRQSSQTDLQSKVDAREEIDLTAAAIKVGVEADSVQETETSTVPAPAPQVITEPVKVEVAPGAVEQPLMLPSLPEVVHQPPPQEIGIDQPHRPEVGSFTPLDLRPAAIDIPEFPEPVVPKAPEFKPSSAADPVFQEPPIPALALDLPGDKVEVPRPAQAAPPLEVPPLEFTSSPVARLDQTTIQSHWEHDLFADAVMHLTDYKDESRRWRRNLLTILQMMVDDLRMDNAMLESILRHFELSRRSP